MTTEGARPQAYRDDLRRWLDRREPELGEWRRPHYRTVAESVGHGAGLAALLHADGWSRWGWPEAVGGLGGPATLRAVLVDELWARDLHVPPQYEPLEVMGPPLIEFCPDLATRYLPDFLSGAECWVQAFSEPDAGSDIAAVRTRARREGTGPDATFVVTGQKVWGTLGAFSGRAMVLCRTGSVDSRHRGLTMLFVDLDSPGITTRPIALASGGEHLSEMFFDDVRVPADRLIGQVDGGWAVLMRVLEHERGAYPWLRQAALGCLLREAAEAAEDRGESAARQVGQAYLAVAAARARSAETVGRLAAGLAPGPETSIDKVVLGAAEHAVLDVVADLAPHGLLAGQTDDWVQWRDLWWYSRATTIFGGAAEIQRTLIADRVLRLPTGVGTRSSPAAR